MKSKATRPKRREASEGIALTDEVRKLQNGESMIDETKLQNFGADILIGAYEGGHCGLASWAMSEDGLLWGSENGDYELGDNISYASTILYRSDDDSETGYSEIPLAIDGKIIAEFVTKVGKGEFSQESLPDYGRMNPETLTLLAGVYLGLIAPEDADLDAISNDNIVQMILLGEVIYG